MSGLGAAEFKVGMLVLAFIGLVGFMSMQVSDDPALLSRSNKYWFLMPNAGGLVKNSAVRSAGIPVGSIKDITLQDGQARIDISVRSNVALTTSAFVEIKAQGILGDKHVEVYPGSPTDPPLPSGSQILTVKDQGSLDNLITSVGDVTDSLKDVAKNLKEAVSEDGTRKHVLGRIIKNIEQLTGDIAEMTSQNKGKIGDIVDNVHAVTKDLKELMGDQSETGLKATWARASDAIKNLDEITGKVNRGEGTIGKLINDESTVDELNTAIEGVSSLVDTANRIQTSFDFHGEYLNEVKATKSYIGINIQPGLDRYYQIGIIDDPAGVLETTSTKTTQTSGGSVLSDTTEEKVYKNKIKFTVLFAKNFWDLSVKAGMIENTGGFGVDYRFFRERMKFSLEAFDLTNINVRSTISYNLFYGFYASAGITDAFDKSDRRSAFVGAGLYLTNDDLKLLLTRAPF